MFSLCSPIISSLLLLAVRELKSPSSIFSLLSPQLVFWPLIRNFVFSGSFSLLWVAYVDCWWVISAGSSCKWVCCAILRRKLWLRLRKWFLSTCSFPAELSGCPLGEVLPASSKVSATFKKMIPLYMFLSSWAVRFSTRSSTSSLVESTWCSVVCCCLEKYYLQLCSWWDQPAVVFIHLWVLRL